MAITNGKPASSSPAFAWSILAALLLPAATASAHDAPSGWSYPLSCCSGMDCNEIPASRVRETANGYRISLGASDHVMLIAPENYSVPYTDGRVKVAPDGVYHACISRQSIVNGVPIGGRLICLFTPPKGF